MNDKQRAEFESKFGSAYWFDNKHNEKGDYYFSKETQIAYLGYQAALSSPSVMELVEALEACQAKVSFLINNDEPCIIIGYDKWLSQIDKALETWMGK